MVDFWFDQKFSPKLEGVVQLDYGAEDGADANGKKAEWFGLGGWLVYTFNDKWNVATRADYVRDKDGARTFHAPSSAPFFSSLTRQIGQELASVTLTLNFNPVDELLLAPELRYDHSSVDTAFDCHDNQSHSRHGHSLQSISKDGWCEKTFGRHGRRNVAMAPCFVAM